MGVVDVGLVEESQTRYLTYALSVVNSRALPDVRDGLKPVQRRILYAMSRNLHLDPGKSFRKSAAVVGEVLARYHPHGDSACYDAMVRMAQDFSLRYPLVDGQGNFGSLDGDSAAAYRYTEARLAPFAIEVIGDIREETVAERENFDQTQMEPVVLPSRVPNLLVNGASGIAVGMATAIPPHNLRDVCKAVIKLVTDPKTIDTVLINAIKGPDFPTGCSVVNTKDELRQIYATGRGAIRMRGECEVEDLQRGKKALVVTSIPYGLDKSVLVERIADLIIGRKLPQLVDIRDESTDDVRIVMELAPQANAEAAQAFLYKNTNLQCNFNVNLTALVPTENPLSGKPELLTLRSMLEHFATFRLSVTREKLLFEKGKLEARIHLLEGLMLCLASIKKVIDIVQKSSGRSDAAGRLQKAFKLSEEQAFFVVDLHIYQLSRTSIEDVQTELQEKIKRLKEIDRILKSDKALRMLVAQDLERIVSEYGDARRSKIDDEVEAVELDADEFIEHEEVYVIVTKDGWVKRIRQTNDPETTRIREGDELFFSAACDTRNCLAIFTSAGNLFACRVHELVATSGFGVPVQKMFRFADGEQIVACRILDRNGGNKDLEGEIFAYTERGLGLRLAKSYLNETKRIGKRIMRVQDNDRMAGVVDVERKMFFLVTEQGYGLFFLHSEVPLLSNPGKGVILQKLPREDRIAGVCCVNKSNTVELKTAKGVKKVAVSALTIGARAKRGLKVVQRAGAVEAIVGVKN
jgi:DNA gyrase subunit A